MGDWLSQPVSYFHGRALPEPAVPAGYAALIDRFDLAVPLPRRLTAIADRHHPVSGQSWRVLTPRGRPHSEKPPARASIVARARSLGALTGTSSPGLQRSSC